MNGAVLSYDSSPVVLRDGAAWGDMWRVHDAFPNWDAERAGVCMTLWAVPRTVSDAGPLRNVPEVLVTLTRCP
jgi:hypothetical protein